MIISKKRYIRSKWQRNRPLLKHKQIVPHLPQAKSFKLDTLKKMLKKYGMVYLKPVNGLKGRGIMRAEKLKIGSETKYRLRKGTSAAVFSDVKALYRYVRRRIGTQPYMVQQGIRVLQYHGRPFDFRIMVQPNEKRKWKVSGIFGRVARPKQIVTNRSQGGKILPAEALLRPYLGRYRVKLYLNALFGLSHRTARQFHRAYPKVRELGVDIALDRRLKPWILEVNTRPAVTGFTRLRDKRMLWRILKLKRLNRKRFA